MSDKATLLALADPINIVGCYDLHCYCKWDNPAHYFNEFPHKFGTDCETGGQARNAARRAGWVLHHDGTGTCPKCAKALRALANGGSDDQ